MSTKLISRTDGYLPRAQRAALRGLPTLSIAIAATLTLSANALAQTVSGAIDPSTGLSNLAPYFLTLVAAASVLITAWKGTHAVAEGRSLGPSIVGLVGGLALAFGGYYVMSKYGVATTA